MRIKTEILEGDIIRVFLAYGSTTYRFMVDVDEALEIHDTLGRAIFKARFPGKDFPVNVGIDLDEVCPSSKIAEESDLDRYRRLVRPDDPTNVVKFQPQGIFGQKRHFDP